VCAELRLEDCYNAKHDMENYQDHSSIPEKRELEGKSAERLQETVQGSVI